MKKYTTLKEIEKILKRFYKYESIPEDFNYKNIKKWMTNETKGLKDELNKKYPKLSTRISLYEQKGLQQFIAFITFVLEDGPHFAVQCYTWDASKTGKEFKLNKVNI